MAHPRAGIDVVGAEAGADQLLDEKRLFVGAAAGGDPAQRPRAILRLDRIEPCGGEGQGLVPADFAPGFVDAVADHRLGDPVLVVGIAPREPALDAGMAAIGLAVLPRHHPHQLLAPHLRAEGAANAAIGAGGDDRAFGLADLLHGLLLQGRGRAGLHTRAAGHAFARQEIVASLSRADLGGKAAPVNGQRQRALHFVAGAHAARTGDALAGIEIEIGVRRIGRETEVVGAVIAIAHIAQAHLRSGVLKLAIARGTARQAIERVVGNVEFHHPAPQLFQPRGLGMDHHVRFGGGGAAGRRAAPSVDFDQAHPARTERGDIVGRAEFRDRAATFRRRAHHAGPGGNGYLPSVDGQRDSGVRADFRRAEIGLRFIPHRDSPDWPDRRAC